MCDSNVNANPYVAGPFRFLGLTASGVHSSTKSRPAMYNVTAPDACTTMQCSTRQTIQDRTVRHTCLTIDLEASNFKYATL